MKSARWMLWTAIAGAGAITMIIALGERDESRLSAVAVESEAAAALCAQTGYPIDEFWARAKALGVSAALLRERSLDQALARGEILRFTSEEIEKWKAVGLVSPGVDLRPNALWTKDARIFELAVQAIARQGISYTTATEAGFRIVQLPESVGKLYLQSFDPETVRRLRAAGVAPIYAEDSGPLGSIALELRRSGWEGTAFPPGPIPAPLVLEPARWRVGGGLGALRRSALSHPRRLLVLDLDPQLGLEGNFAAVRAGLREIGLSGQGLPASRPAQPPVQPLLRVLGLAALWLFGGLGPLLAARLGLIALKAARGVVLQRAPRATPIPQIAAGLLASGASSVAFGLAARASLVAAGIDAATPAWALWTIAAPLLAAMLTLYTIDAEAWSRRLVAAVTYARLLRALAVLVGAAFLFSPRQLLPSWLSPAAIGWADALGLWWLSWRWREVFVGLPCLIQAMYLICKRLDCPDCESTQKQPLKDPRLWFVLGLLGPAGAVAAVGRGSAPLDAALLQSALSLALGAAAGVAALGLRFYLASSGSKVPERDRTIVPDAEV